MRLLAHRKKSPELRFYTVDKWESLKHSITMLCDHVLRRRGPGETHKSRTFVHKTLQGVSYDLSNAVDSANMREDHNSAKAGVALFATMSANREIDEVTGKPVQESGWTNCIDPWQYACMKRAEIEYGSMTVKQMFMIPLWHHGTIAPRTPPP